MVGRGAAAIVLPSPCTVCERELPWRDRRGSCCGPCWRSLPVAEGARCRVCSLRVDSESSSVLCGECTRRPADLEWIESYGPYSDGLDRLLTAFKFESHHFLARPLAELLAVAASRRSAGFDVVTGVPMEPSRERTRGFNQAELLARELGKLSGIRHERRLLRRVGRSLVQSTLPKDARRKNVHGRFAAGSSAAGSSVLVVDDICTTGETLRECARILRKAGAERVAAVTVARA